MNIKSWARTSLVVQWVRLHTPNAGGPGSIFDLGTRSRKPQLRVRMLQLRSPHAATKRFHVPQQQKQTTQLKNVQKT